MEHRVHASAAVDGTQRVKTETVLVYVQRQTQSTAQ